MSSRELLGGVAVGAVLVALGGVLADRLTPTPPGAGTVQPVVIAPRSAVDVTPETERSPEPVSASTVAPAPAALTTATTATTSPPAPRKSKKTSPPAAVTAPTQATASPRFRSRPVRATRMRDHDDHDHWRDGRDRDRDRDRDGRRGGDHRRGR